MTKSNLNKEYDYIESISNSIGKKLKNNDKLTEEEVILQTNMICLKINLMSAN